MENKKRKPSGEMKAKRIISIAATLPNMNKGKIPSDVQGSYTGMSADGTPPVQDADDL